MFKNTKRALRHLASLSVLASVVAGQDLANATQLVDGVDASRRSRASRIQTGEIAAFRGAVQLAGTQELLSLPAANAPEEDFAGLRREDELTQTGGPLRAGVVSPIEPIRLTAGEPVQLEDGGLLWTVEIAAMKAEGMRLGVEPLRLPQGAELWVYPAENPELARGPFGQRISDRLWTPTVWSQRARLELFVPPNAPLEGIDEVAVTAVGQLYRSPLQPLDGQAGTALNCHLDVSCFPLLQQTANGVGHTCYIESGFVFWCSGSLLNRQAYAEDFTPLFLSAQHCGFDSNNVDTVEIAWFFQTSSCGGAAPSLNASPVSLGATVLRSSWDSDTILLGLDFTVPGGSFFLGWDSAALANGSAVTGIHHPAGSFKRVSFGEKDGDDGSLAQPDLSCGGTDGWEVTWDSGLLEPGSSGSPLLDASNRVRGVASCGAGDCSSTSTASYGRFQDAYSMLDEFLAPEETVYVSPTAPSNEEGSQAAPFDTLIEAVYAVPAGNTVRMLPGTYGGLTISKPMVIEATSGGVVIQ